MCNLNTTACWNHIRPTLLFFLSQSITSPRVGRARPTQSRRRQGELARPTTTQAARRHKSRGDPTDSPQCRRRQPQHTEPPSAFALVLPCPHPRRPIVPLGHDTVFPCPNAQRWLVPELTLSATSSTRRDTDLPRAPHQSFTPPYVRAALWRVSCPLSPFVCLTIT